MLKIEIKKNAHQWHAFLINPSDFVVILRYSHGILAWEESI